MKFHLVNRRHVDLLQLVVRITVIGLNLLWAQLFIIPSIRDGTSPSLFHQLDGSYERELGDMHYLIRGGRYTDPVEPSRRCPVLYPHG